ncbi:MAG: hypothetical protein ACD_46C00270G0002 [uncultured bacterium]|nr:MAG: hypothetical protein ACD_46C00270G0002 [uncultured bacterium]
MSIDFTLYEIIDSVKYREKIQQLYLEFSLYKKTKITNFCIGICFKDNKKYFLSNMPDWAIQWHKIGGSRSDEVFNLELMRNRNHYIPRHSKYDFVQQFLVEREEENFKYFDTYSLIRRHTDCTFILLALHNHKVIDPQKIHDDTYDIFEDFCIYFISNMITKIIEKNSEYKSLPIFTDKRLLTLTIKNGLIKETKKLTDREYECIKLMKNNYPPKLISRAMNITEKTVRNYIESIKEKLGCSSIFEIYEKSIQYDL